MGINYIFFGLESENKDLVFEFPHPQSFTNHALHVSSHLWYQSHTAPVIETPLIKSRTDMLFLFRQIPRRVEVALPTVYGTELYHSKSLR